MGEYGFYVWPSVAVVLTSLIWLMIHTWIMSKKVKKDIIKRKR